MPARRTDSLQAPAAAAAELGAGGVVLSALRATHSHAPVGLPAAPFGTDRNLYEPSFTSMISSAMAPWASRCTAAAASLLGA